MKYLIFDFDGTIHKSENIYIKAFRETEKEVLENNLVDKKITDEKIKSFIGISPKKMWNDYLPNLPEDQINYFSNKIGELMITYTENQYGRLYDYSSSVLKNLIKKGYQLIILSNCKIKYLEAMKKAYKLDEYFIDYFTAEEYHYLQKYEIYKIIKKKYPGEHIMIGDKESDILVGVKNNIKTIGCLYGYGSTLELQRSTTTITNLKDLSIILKG